MLLLILLVVGIVLYLVECCRSKNPASSYETYVDPLDTARQEALQALLSVTLALGAVQRPLRIGNRGRGPVTVYCYDRCCICAVDVNHRLLDFDTFRFIRNTNVHAKNCMMALLKPFLWERYREYRASNTVPPELLDRTLRLVWQLCLPPPDRDTVCHIDCETSVSLRL